MPKKITISVIVVAILAVSVAYAFRKDIALRAMRGIVEDTMTADIIAELPDGLHVGLCGAGAPLSDDKRSGPCIFVIAGTQLFVIDAGTNGARVLARMRVPMGRIRAIFMTHYHSDHIDGLGELALQRWIGGANTSPLPVYGVPGVERIVDGFNLAYTEDFHDRTAHHGEDIAPASGAGMVARPFPGLREEENEIVFDEGGVRITAFGVSHDPVEFAVGYRIEYKDRSVVIGGDTAALPYMSTIARGADLLLHEALSRRLVSIIAEGARAAGRNRVAKIMDDIQKYHTTPVEAARIAQEAGVGHLLFYHIVPPLPAASLEDVFMEGVDDAYDGQAILGEDGTFISMPAGEKTVIVSSRL